jgi:hypothetical protein
MGKPSQILNLNLLPMRVLCTSALILVHLLGILAANTSPNTISCPEFFGSEISEKKLSLKFKNSLQHNPEIKISPGCVEL